MIGGRLTIPCRSGAPSLASHVVLTSQWLTIGDKIVDSRWAVYQALRGEAVPTGPGIPVIEAEGTTVMTYVISEGCLDVKDRTCLDNCPVDCIYEGDRMVYSHPAECIDRGAGEPICPQDAIYFEPRLPDELSQYAAINTEFFSDIGSPGGAGAVDYTDRDHPSVAALPPRSDKS